MPTEKNSTPSGIFRLEHRSISRELTLSLILLIVLFQGILMGIFYQREARGHLQVLEAKADDHAKNLKEVLAVPIWNYDDEQISRIGDVFYRDPVVDEIRIIDSDGRTLYHSMKEKRPGDRISRKTGIVYRNRTVGTVDLYISMAGYYRALAVLRNTFFLVLAVSIVVIFITTGALLRVIMRKPLRSLQEGIDRVAQGDYTYAFDELHHWELSEIADRFRQMAADVNAREESLLEEVSERKRAVQKILASEANIRALIEAIPDLMFRYDRAGKCIDFQGAVKDLYLSPENLLGKNIRDVLPKQTADLYMEKIRAALETRHIQVFEYALGTDGNQKHYECRLVAVREEETLAIVRNISDRVEAAAEKERLEEKLSRARKMEAIGTLAGGVAHDLNNVLSGIVGYPELLLMDLPPDSRLRKPIRMIQQSGEKAANIVQDLLTLARRGVAVSEPVNLNDIINEFLNSPEYAKLCTYNENIRLDLDLAPDLLTISGSPVHLSKTVMNLISNAAEAIQGKGRISISTVNRYIDVPIKGYDDVQEGDYVELIVSDTGVGISDRDIAQIFEPFYTKKVMGRSGTGLGMAVVWGTVKDHHGYIDVKSRVEEGTTITIYLPATRQDPLKKESIPEADAIAGRGESVLVVDDVEEQREIAEKMLKKLGYAAVSVSSGQEAVEFVRITPVDLVVLDMIMDPGIDGLETYRQVIQYRPGQKALITSGFSESERVREAQDLGVGAYIKKPYRLETLGAAVRAELDKE
jgi:two-component system, cell cycle sensor histidine kinase and response regulator CckA